MYSKNRLTIHVALYIIKIYNVNNCAEAEMTDKYTRAQALYGQRQYVEAAELFRAAAEEGDARAMSMLGVMYYSGKGVKKDADEAIRLYKLSAEKGDVNGMLRLASAYQLGWDVEESYETALCWFERAAECGSAKGAYRAGQFHAQGLTLKGES